MCMGGAPTNHREQGDANDDGTGELKPLTGTELKTRLDALEAERAATVPRQKVKALAIAEIDTEEEVFQVRGNLAPDEAHVMDLRKALKETKRKRLDPLSVMQIGGRYVLTDGHHRLEAYRREGVTGKVPVRLLEGTVMDALGRTEATNGRAKLVLTSEERSERAWRYVCLGPHGAVRGFVVSNDEISERTGVSVSTITTMRKVFREYAGGCIGGVTEPYGDADGEGSLVDSDDGALSEANEGALREPEGRTEDSGDRMADIPPWRFMLWKDKMVGAGDDEIKKERMCAQAMRWAKGINKAVKRGCLANNPEVAAMALREVLGDRMLEVARHMYRLREEEMLKERDACFLEGDLTGHLPVCLEDDVPF